MFRPEAYRSRKRYVSLPLTIASDSENFTQLNRKLHDDARFVSIIYTLFSLSHFILFIARAAQHFVIIFFFCANQHQSISSVNLNRALTRSTCKYLLKIVCQDWHLTWCGYDSNIKWPFSAVLDSTSLVAIILPLLW